MDPSVSETLSTSDEADAPLRPRHHRHRRHRRSGALSDGCLVCINTMTFVLSLSAVALSVVALYLTDEMRHVSGRSAFLH